VRFELRPYQQRGADQIRQKAREGHKRILAVGPTAMGKTALACSFIEACVKLGKKAIFVVHRKEIAEQTLLAFQENGIHCAALMSGHSLIDPSAPVQVCSIQTLTATKICKSCKNDEQRKLECEACHQRGRVPSRPLPEADLIVLDECHRARSKSYMDLLEGYPPSTRTLGLTATPRRLDGKGLGGIFSAMVVIAEMQELIDQGFLVPLRYFTPYVPDLTGVSIVHGDYNAQELQAAVNKDTRRIGNIVENWKQRGEGRTTVFFGCSIADSMSVAAKFRDAGIPAEHVDANTPAGDRKAIFERLRRGETKILCNVDIATEGVDIPSLGCVILGRPTKSVTVYLQGVGRAMRLFPGKSCAIILDHAGCVYEHKPAEWPRKWSLSDRRRGEKLVLVDLELTTCDECGLVRASNVKKCPGCQKQQEMFDIDIGGDVAEREGELVEFNSALMDAFEKARKAKPPQPGFRICQICRKKKVRVSSTAGQIKVTCRDCVAETASRREPPS